VEWSFVAGFFDGEGNVANRMRGKSSNPYWQLQFSNTNLEVLRAIRNFLGTGNIYEVKPKPPGKKVCYSLRIYGARPIVKVADSMLPFAIVKKPQLLKLRKAIRSHQSSKFKPGFSLLPPEELEALYTSGLSTRAIGKRLGVSGNAVLRRMKLEGIARRHF
jgi:hypothetical protein